MAKGTIKRIFGDKGYGFIQPDAGGADIWFHASKVEGYVPFEELDAGLAVEYEAQRTQRGLQATAVRASAVPVSSQPELRQAPAYRFLNPYNFVRIPSVSEASGHKEPVTVMSTALGAAGVQNEGAEPPLPQTKLLGRCVPPPHDRYVGITGIINCEMEAVTPMFVSDSENIEVSGKHKSYEFFKVDGKYAVPATGLRGVVRSVFEAVTNSCLGMWDEVYLSYHVDAANASKLVPARVERDETGNWSLRLLPGTTNLSLGRRPGGPQYAAWIPRYLSRPLRRSRYPAGETDYGARKDVPLNGYKHTSHCWALLEQMSHPRRNFEFWSVKQIGNDATRLPKPQKGESVAEGYLCITNQNIENKHDERFFFYEKGINNAPRSLSEIKGLAMKNQQLANTCVLLSY